MGSGHIALTLDESWNRPNSLASDPLWNLCLPEVEAVLLVHGYLPPEGWEQFANIGTVTLAALDTTCGDSLYWPLLDWLQDAYPGKSFSLFNWCMNDPAPDTINDLASEIQTICQDNCVIISHSAGGLYTTAALGNLFQDGWNDSDHVIGHIALASAQGGTQNMGITPADICVSRDGTSFADISVCQALYYARESTGCYFMPCVLPTFSTLQLRQWRQDGAANYRHRYITTKSPSEDHEGVLPTHSVCGVSDAQMPGNDQNKHQDRCSGFLTNSPTPAQYFGHADSSYELYDCNYGDYNCHGVLPGNQGNIACQLFRGYVDWDDCSVATINIGQTDIKVIYNSFSDDEVEVTVNFTNNSAAELSFDVQLYTVDGNLVDTEPDVIDTPPDYITDPYHYPGWKPVQSGGTAAITVSSEGHFSSLQDFGDSVIVKLREYYTAMGNRSVDTFEIPIPEPGGQIESVQTECIPVLWADPDFVAEVKFENDGGTSGEYKVFLESESGEHIDVEYDEVWKDLLPSQSHTIQVGTNLDPTWSIKNVDGGFKIVLKEQHNGVMDTFSSDGASCPP